MDDAPPRRQRRLPVVWPNHEGTSSWLLTLCVEGRRPVLDNEPTFERTVSFLIDSSTRYHWFGRRFVIMPDHIHLIAHMGHDAIRLGHWIKALKAVVGGLDCRVEAHGRRDNAPAHRAHPHEFARLARAWRWQDGFHDHKFRSRESETRKWEYVCMNPVRAGLVKRPDDWPFGGEVFYDEPGGPRLVRGTPPLLEQGLWNEEGQTPQEGAQPARSKDPSAR